MLPPDNPLRLVLADEVHARPSETLATPARSTYIAVLVDPADRERERSHIVELCRHYGVLPPAVGAIHFSGQMDTFRFKWERHGEFSGFTVIAAGLGPTPFARPVSTLLPAGWLERVPGNTLVAVHAELRPAAAEPPDPFELAAYFEGNVVVGGEVSAGAGYACTDFRVHSDGFGRVVIGNRSLTDRQAGRTLQRLFEIEAYRMMTLLALPIARGLAPRIDAVEASLASLTGRIADGDGQDDEALLQELTRMAAEIEGALTTSQFRFGACRAYHELVTTRIGELRESRLPGIQPIAEFMARRLTPAAATCDTASRRLDRLSERIARASNLLSTRVDIARERQNQALLASMNRRAMLQLRLQQTVEGLSVAAIVYYVVGVLAYLAKAGKAAGLPLQPDLLTGIAVPVVAVGVVISLRRARHRLHAGGSTSDG